MNDKNLLNIGEKLVKYGLNEGADDIQISINDENNFRVEVRKGKIEKLEEAGSKSLSIKVIKDQKRATATSSNFDLEVLKGLVSGAVKRTSFGNKDQFLCLPDLQKITVKEKNLNLFDPEVLKISSPKKIAIAKKVDAIALKMDKRITNSYGGWFGSGYGTYYLVNSKGFVGFYSGTQCSFGTYLQAGPTDNSVFGGWNTFNRFFNKLEDIESVAKKAVERTVRQLNPKKVKTQNVPVIFEPQQATGILQFLYQCINGPDVYQKRTFLAEKLNEKVAASRVNIFDDGLMPGKIGTRLFDWEGVLTQKTTVIKGGILKNFLLDTYAAKKLKQKSTGNASGANNFYLKAGEHLPENIIKSVKKGLLLTLTMGQGANAITGDISKGAAGLWIEDGQIVYPVAEITISGNLGEILQNIEMIGNDLEFRDSFSCPTLKVGGITVGGK